MGRRSFFQHAVPAYITALFMGSCGGIDPSIDTEESVQSLTSIVDKDPESQTGKRYLTVLNGKGEVMQMSALTGVCFCPFKGNIGEMTFDTSCRGTLAVWAIPELADLPAFTPPIAGTSYYLDGFKYGSQVYKIDGSTCNTVSASGGYYYIDTCVNTLVSPWKGPPYPVPNGTFTNEPPAGVAAQYVR